MNLTRREAFAHRHVGPDETEVRQMLGEFQSQSLDAFVGSVIPEKLRARSPLKLEPALGEHEVLSLAREMASRNVICRSLIGMGYYDTITPPVIQRNILENPGWYTQYTPYQAEIAQGRLEALLNFQTMVIDMTSFPIADASLLDEATAAAEAMIMFFNIKGQPQGKTFFVSEGCHPQTIGVLRTRAKHLGITVVVGDEEKFTFTPDVFGAIIQYPTTDGAVRDYRGFCARAHDAGALVVAAADILSLTVLVPPAGFDADAAVGNTQRFGVPMGYGGPHAAYFATKDEFKRHVPGRIIGVSIDTRGRPALRMALQTREQHIRREKATSNICTSQVLLAIMAGMYAVYHGPEGLKAIGERVHNLAKIFASGLKRVGLGVVHGDFYDTVRIRVAPADRARIAADLLARGINIRHFGDGSFGISFDELSDPSEVDTILSVFGGGKAICPPALEMAASEPDGYQGSMKRKSPYLTHPVFNTCHSETQLLRYIKSLEEKDLSLAQGMIPLGSCTMKLNATAELMPITWPGFARLHPFAPREQALGYHELFAQLIGMIKEITGFEAISLQPNSGAAGEYTGLLVIRAYHESRGETHRNVCLIPSSAHGTNPASAIMAGMEVVVVRAKEDGSIDIADLGEKAKQHAGTLAALMVTSPSTHGVFEEGNTDICSIVHRNGGLVYMDGANLNAQVGLCRPAELGADVCHLNLHKTFSIPHGGGGPGVGPIGVVGKLVPFLPSHPVVPLYGDKGIGPVSAAPWGSAGVFVISWAYIRMMGPEGLTHATKIAILNANYLAKRLGKDYPVLYTGVNGRVAHEFILDCRQFKETSGVEAEDISKRLMDYGFHAPTVSFPVHGTLMTEPTESESKAELDRYIDALVSIRNEIREIEQGKADRENNVLKNAPHTADMVSSDSWKFPYSREKAAYPSAGTRARKFWPSVGRINGAYGDRNLICSCPPAEAYTGA